MLAALDIDERDGLSDPARSHRALALDVIHARRTLRRAPADPCKVSSSRSPRRAQRARRLDRVARETGLAAPIFPHPSKDIHVDVEMARSGIFVAGRR